jgi:O-antigen/teichoic acid export membrane protein
VKENNKISLNLIIGLLTFSLNIIVSFFLTPFLVKNLGIESYGFLSLSLNIVNYMTIITFSINSMAARFITFEIEKQNWEKVNNFFNTTLFANILFSIISITLSLIFILFIDKILIIPSDITNDVKLLFIFLVLNFAISLIGSTFGISLFAQNKIYLRSLREFESILIRAFLLLSIFSFFESKLFYIGLIASVVSIYKFFFDYKFTIKNISEISVNRSLFNKNSFFQLFSSGIWNTIVRIGQILLEGLDLVIANLFLGPVVMGVLALSKTIPLIIINMVNVVSNSFLPNLTILYAKNDLKNMVTSINISIKTLAVITNIPVVVLIVFGERFFNLWLPEENSFVIQILSILSISTIIFSGPLASLYGVFTIVNKVRENALIVVLSGIINIILVYLLLRFTNLGMFAIAGVSAIMSIFRNLLYTAPFAAKYLGLRWFVFFPNVIKSAIALMLSASIGMLFLNYILVIDWFSLILYSGLLVCITIFINIVLVLNKNEIKELLNTFKKYK